MRQRHLGTNGPEVSALGLGCLSFGGMFGPTTEADTLRTLDSAWDPRITFLDTANRFGECVTETMIGPSQYSRGHRALIATQTTGLLGDFFWPTPAGSSERDVHTKIYGVDQRVAFLGETTEGELRYVLSRIFYHSKASS